MMIESRSLFHLKHIFESRGSIDIQITFLARLNVSPVKHNFLLIFIFLTCKHVQSLEFLFSEFRSYADICVLYGFTTWLLSWLKIEVPILLQLSKDLQPSMSRDWFLCHFSRCLLRFKIPNRDWWLKSYSIVADFLLFKLFFQFSPKFL